MVVVDVNGTRLRPDAVIALGEREVGETGECVELACVVMRPAAGGACDVEPLHVVRLELPVEVRELALFVLEVWREARGLGA